MLNKKSVLQGLLLSAAVAFSSIASAGSMNLDENMSKLSFVSVKKGTVGEAHSLNKLTGSLSDKGELKISMFLSSVETNIPIRNTRMKRHLFMSEENPIATITANVSGMVPTEAGVKMLDTEGELNMRGVKKTIKVSVMVAHTGKELVVSSIKPIIIKASDYGMEEGVKKLQELAKLPSIATAVPVNFSLVFK